MGFRVYRDPHRVEEEQSNRNRQLDESMWNLILKTNQAVNETPRDQIKAYPNAPINLNGIGPGGAEEPIVGPEDLVAAIPWKSMAKLGLKGATALTDEIGASLMRPSSYQITSPIKNVGHLSKQTKLQLKDPSKVANVLRYDEGGSVFGKNTYFDETGDWVAKNGAYNSPGARGISGDIVYSADLSPKKALLITPENFKNLQKKGLIPDNSTNIAEHLSPKGYDSVVIRGMNDKIDAVNNKFYKLEDNLFKKKDENNWSFEKFKEERDKLYNKIYKKEFGNYGDRAESYQDQIVVFDPTKTVSRFEPLGHKSDVTKEMVQKGVKSDIPIQRPLSSYVKRKLNTNKNTEGLYDLWKGLLEAEKN